MKVRVLFYNNIMPLNVNISMNKITLLIKLLVIFVCFSSYADKSNWATIKQINYNGSADYLFFVTSGKWIITDGVNNVVCQPTYIQVRDNVRGREKILSIGLAAKLSGQNIQFHGSCNTDTNYFDATYIIIR